MKLFAIYGNPVSHSKSPLMHNYVFKKLGFDGCYTRILLENGAHLRADFLARNLDGANITIPHKEAAFLACDEVRGFAQNVGVVNTIIKEGDKLIGYNTDADGFMMALSKLGTPKNVLILGAGGTAKALAQKFIDEGLPTTVVNRSAHRLEHFKTLACEIATWDTLTIKPYDLIVNTTSAGLNDQELPLPIEYLKPLIDQALFLADAIYGKTTPFLKLAQHQRSMDGKQMLIGQGVLAHMLFTARAYNQSDIHTLMQESLLL